MRNVWGQPAKGSGLNLSYEEGWQDEAACKYVDPELFYINKGEMAKIRQAKKICATCPVIDQCRDWAFRVNDRFAVLGGLTEFDRRRVRRDRKAA